MSVGYLRIQRRLGRIVVAIFAIVVQVLRVRIACRSKAFQMRALPAIQLSCRRHFAPSVEGCDETLQMAAVRIFALLGFIQFGRSPILQVGKRLRKYQRSVRGSKGLLS